MRNFLPRPITETDYERELARLVARFERDCAQVRSKRYLREDSGYARMYQAFCASSVPLTAREAALRAGLPTDGAKAQMQYGVTTEHLEANGWVEQAGTVERTWIAGWDRKPKVRPVKTFKAVIERDKEPGPTLVNAFLTRIDRLNQRRAVSSCMTQRITTVARPMSARDQQIIAARLDGRVLEDIGEEHGVTRERIRQIVEKATKPQIIREPKPKKLPQRQYPSPATISALRSANLYELSHMTGVNRATLYRALAGKRLQRSKLAAIELALPLIPAL